MVSDRVGDFIVQLQNAAAIGKREVRVLHSAHLIAIAKKLKDIGFITEVKTSAEGAKKILIVTLAYTSWGAPKIQGVLRVSKPGCRIYSSHLTAHNVKGGTGARILSTPAGILSDTEARRQRVGGENLFEIW